MNRTDRLLGVLLELQRKKWVRAEDLATHFETSKRTIYRDVMNASTKATPSRRTPNAPRYFRITCLRTTAFFYYQPKQENQ